MPRSQELMDSGGLLQELDGSPRQKVEDQHLPPGHGRNVGRSGSIDAPSFGMPIELRLSLEGHQEIDLPCGVTMQGARSAHEDRIDRPSTAVLGQPSISDTAILMGEEPALLHAFYGQSANGLQVGQGILLVEMGLGAGRIRQIQGLEGFEDRIECPKEMVGTHGEPSMRWGFGEHALETAGSGTFPLPLGR